MMRTSHMTSLTRHQCCQPPSDDESDNEDDDTDNINAIDVGDCSTDESYDEAIVMTPGQSIQLACLTTNDSATDSLKDIPVIYDPPVISAANATEALAILSEVVLLGCNVLLHLLLVPIPTPFLFVSCASFRHLKVILKLDLPHCLVGI